MVLGYYRLVHLFSARSDLETASTVLAAAGLERRGIAPASRAMRGWRFIPRNTALTTRPAETAHLDGPAVSAPTPGAFAGPRALRPDFLAAARAGGGRLPDRGPKN